MKQILHDIIDSIENEDLLVKIYNFILGLLS